MIFAVEADGRKGTEMLRETERGSLSGGSVFDKRNMGLVREFTACEKIFRRGIRVVTYMKNIYIFANVSVGFSTWVHSPSKCLIWHRKIEAVPFINFSTAVFFKTIPKGIELDSITFLVSGSYSGCQIKDEYISTAGSFHIFT